MEDKDWEPEAAVGTGYIKISAWLGTSRTNVPIVIRPYSYFPWIIFISGPERRRYVIVGYPYFPVSKDERDGIMSQALDDECAQKVRGAAIIRINIQRNDYPYSVFATRMSTDLFDTLS